MAEEQYPSGMFCWNELVTRDEDKASAFYTEVLGWEAVDSGMPGMKYTLFKVGEKSAGGMMKMPDEIPAEVPSHWMAYITVPDVDAAAAKAKELGGNVIHGPEDIPEMGRFCVIQDPTGAVVSLMTFVQK
jgi:predicted enzyme related to lactoylglutathione lyase